MHQRIMEHLGSIQHTDTHSYTHIYAFLSLNWPKCAVCDRENETNTIRGTSGCHGNAFWQTVSLVVFICAGLDDNKDKVCVNSTGEEG